MNTRKCLFIGGSRDGDYMEIPANRQDIELAVSKPARIEMDFEGNVPQFAKAPAMERYVLDELRSRNGSQYFFLRHVSISNELMCSMLLENYRPQSKNS